MPNETIQKYYASPTDIGTAAIANAVLTGQKINITHFAVGNGGGAYYLPTKDMTELRGEVWRTALSHAQLAPEDANTLDFYAILPPDVGGFTIREMGIFDDKDQLIGVCNTPDIQKVTFNEGVSFDSVLIISLAVVAPEVLEYRIDPYVIIATLKDINVHNLSVKAHLDVRDEIKQLGKTVNSNMAEGQAALANKVNKCVLQKYNLPVSEGFQITDAGHFWKDPFGLVTVTFEIIKVTPPFGPGTYCIATLPVGFRPDGYIAHVNAVARGVSGYQSTYTFVPWNGTVNVYIDKVNKEIAGTISFYTRQ